MAIKRRTSTSWVDLSHLRRRTSTGWTDLSFLRRRTSTGWVDILDTGGSAVATFQAVSADAYRLSGDFGAGWRGDNIAYHGGVSGNHKGMWFYGNISGQGVGNDRVRQATSGRIRVYAGNSYSGTRTLVLRPHNYTTRPSGNPDYLTGTRSYNLPSRAWTWISITNLTWLTNILNGQARGIGCYTTTTNQYIELNGSANLEISYTY